MANPNRQVDQRLLQEAQHDPTLNWMIKNGAPLTRQKWIELNWGGETPQPWTAEDEAQLPELWQRPVRAPAPLPVRR